MSQKTQVFFIPVKDTDAVPAVQGQLRRLLEASRILSFVQPSARVILKIHFGEEKNTGFVKPEYARVVSEQIIQAGGLPVLSDTNTLYRGMRTNSSDHLKIAARHGFVTETTRAEVFIPENAAENSREVPINQKFIKVAKIARVYLECDALVALSHFKGHIMTGFGGAIKNIGMGCAMREGKLEQHSNVAPFVYDKRCTACGACIRVCPANAIGKVNNVAFINEDLCIGCASCIAACDYNAIDVNWESGSDKIQQKMVEYAKAVMDSQNGKMAYVNFAVKITKECDCLAQDDPRISPDIGILASRDPVAVDRASYDLVVQACGEDVFREVHPQRNGLHQLEYAQQLGLGSQDYELIEIE